MMSCNVTIAIEIVSLDLRWKRSNKLGSVSFRFVPHSISASSQYVQFSSVQFSSVRWMGSSNLVTLALPHLALTHFTPFSTDTIQRNSIQFNSSQFNSMQTRRQACITTTQHNTTQHWNIYLHVQHWQRGQMQKQMPREVQIQQRWIAYWY